MDPQQIEAPTATTSQGVETQTAANSSSQPSGVQGQNNGVNNVELLSELAKERNALKQLQTQLQAQTQKEQELQKQLDSVKNIDPAQYERLLKEQAERDEQNLLKRAEFDKARESYRQQTEAANKKAEEAHQQLETMTVRTATEKAFYECGGRKTEFDLSAQGGEDIAPVEAILALLKPKLRIEDGRVVILNSVGAVEVNSEGRPKTLTEKMTEIKKGSMGSLFAPENMNAGSGMNPTTTNRNGQPVKLYTREQARNGKASMSEIAYGKAFVN
jgi:hypothetical protein